MNKHTIKKLKSFLTKSSKKVFSMFTNSHLEKKDHKFLQKCVEKMKSRLLVFMKKN